MTPPALSRWGIRSLDGVTSADSSENRALLARFVAVFGTCACGILVAGAVVGGVYNPGHGYQSESLVRAGFVLAVLIIGESLWARHHDAWWAHVYVVTAVLTIVVAVSSVGDYAYMASVMAFAVLMAGIALIGTRGAAVLHLVFIVVAYASMAVHAGHAAPLVETWTVGGSTLIVGGLVSWLVGLAAARADGDRRARAELEIVNARQSAFLANMSHELRTPLNAIIGFADLLGAGAAGPLSERQTEYLEDVRGSGNHLLALIDDVLDLAKVEEGKTELYVGRVELAPTLSAAAGLFREQAGRHRITIDAAIATGLGAIEADERKIKQVVFNLLSNAVRFTPDGGRVELGARRSGAGVEIWVADSGPGIAADEQERIFEEYHQAAPSADARQPGTGLGLALVRKFVELHGGRITVRSRPGDGAVFTVALPVAPSAAPTAEEDADDAMRVRPARGQWWQLRSIEGNVAPGSPENRKRVGQLVSALVIAGTTLVAGAQLMYLRVDATASYRPAGLLAVTFAGMLGGALFRANAKRIPLEVAHPIAMLGTLAVTIGGYYAGANHPEALFGYGVVCISSFAVFELAGAILQTAFIGLCYAALLVVQPGNYGPVSRWMILVPGITVAAMVVLWLVNTMARYAEGERRAQAQLEIVSRHKSEFLANMSHELRTPLNAIIGFSEVLDDELSGPLTPEQHDYVREILTSGRHLLAVINDILDLAKLEAGRMPSTATAVSLAPVLAALSRRRHLAVSGDIEAAVLGDELQLTQLLGNVVAATPRAERLVVAVDQGTVRVAIASLDAPLFADCTRVFEEFHRATGADGTGLELPLARALAELQGGRLELVDDSLLHLSLVSAP